MGISRGKLFSLGVFFLLFQVADANESFHYKLEISPESYELRIKMTFPNHVSLLQARDNFRSSWLLQHLSSSVRSMEVVSTSARSYESKLTVKSWGIESFLVSDCDETHGEISWSRACRLKTDRGDSDRYMVWKEDQLGCKSYSQEVRCEAIIKGLAKPVRFLSLTLLSAEDFTLKAKQQALYNFAKIWIYTVDGSLSTSLTQERFDKSRFKKSLDQSIDQKKWVQVGSFED